VFRDLPVGGFQSSLVSALATLMPDAEQDWGDDRRLSARAATRCWITPTPATQAR
jgi:hypothetical protein